MTNYSFESMPEFSDNSPIDVARLNAIIRNLNSLNRYLRAIASRIPQAPPLLDDSTLNPNPITNPENPGVTDPGNNPIVVPPIPSDDPSQGIYQAGVFYTINASWDDKGKLRIAYPLSGVPNIVDMTVIPVSIQFRPDGSSSTTKRDMLSSGAVSYTSLETNVSNGSFTYKFQGNNLNTSSKYVAGIDYPKAYKNITLNFNIIYTYRGEFYPPQLPPGSGIGYL
jgi:hypothetical protein